MCLVDESVLETNMCVVICLFIHLCAHRCQAHFMYIYNVEHHVNTQPAVPTHMPMRTHRDTRTQSNIVLSGSTLFICCCWFYFDFFKLSVFAQRVR